MRKFRKIDVLSNHEKMNWVWSAFELESSPGIFVCASRMEAIASGVGLAA